MILIMSENHRHFHEIAYRAWDSTQRYLDDDETGDNYSFDQKVYGPYESIKLQRKTEYNAKANIENYVWYALVSQWQA